MTVYSANILDLAQKVTKGKKKAAIPNFVAVGVPSETVQKPKPAPRKRKQQDILNGSTQPVVANAQTVEPVEPVVKVKKPRTEKQLASDQKRREAAVAKKLVAHNETLKSLYHPPKKQTVPVNQSRVIVPKKKGPVIFKEPVSEDVPPRWFEKYILDRKAHENRTSEVKKPAAEVKEEARHMAEETWSNTDVRQKIQKELTTHQEKMYNMMFK